MKIIKSVSILSKFAIHWFHERGSPRVWFTFNGVDTTPTIALVNTTQLSVIDSLLSLSPKQRDETMALYAYLTSLNKNDEILEAIGTFMEEANVYE